VGEGTSELNAVVSNEEWEQLLAQYCGDMKRQLEGQELPDPEDQEDNGETGREEATEPGDGERGQKRKREDADSDETASRAACK